MRAIIFSAGKGERLEPLTHTKPKFLAPLLDKSILDYQIDLLDRIGIKDIYVVVRRDDVQFLKDRSVVPIIQAEGYGTAAALKASRSYIKNETLIVYGDVVVDEMSIKELINQKEEFSLLTAVSSEPQNYGVVLEKDGNVEKIIEKGEGKGDLINAGVYKMNEKILEYIDEIRESPRGELELTDVINLLSKREKVKIVKVRDFWIDVGRPWDVMDVNKLILDRVNSKINGEVEEGARIKGKVVVEEGARIKSGSYIEGPVYIGRGVEVGPNSYIRPYTVIRESAKIGANVEVKGSIILERAKIPHLSYIGDSIVCEEVNVGAGTITANLRLDEEEVKVTIRGKRVPSGRKKLGAFIGGYTKIGINVSIMPGVKIGAFSYIGPNLVVSRDLEKGGKLLRG
jgi:bifunctional UDP-N-acetylglucosamine pyrophosphorylase/glucosamine-1-phosphate N-acetyltransferase